MIWKLPYQTHTNFVEELTNCSHLQAMLHSRYVGFSKSLSQSKKPHIQLLFSLVSYDLTSLTGNNLKFLRSKYDLKSVEEMFEARQKISTEKFNKMPEVDLWKIVTLEDLVNFRENPDETELSLEEIEELIIFVTTS